MRQPDGPTAEEVFFTMTQTIAELRARIVALEYRLAILDLARGAGDQPPAPRVLKPVKSP